MTEQTFFLCWNPEKWPWPPGLVEGSLAQLRSGKPAPLEWSIGSRRGGINPGDRGYLLRQGSQPRGVVAAGRFTGEVEQSPHWDGTGRPATYAVIELDSMALENPLPLDELRHRFPHQAWTPQGGGIRVHDDAAAGLHELWREHEPVTRRR